VHLTTTELHQLAADVDDQHRDAMRTIEEDLEELHFGETAKVLAGSRRQFLKRAGMGGALLTIGSTLVPISRFMPAAWASQGLDDGAIAVFAESVELAAVQAYTAAGATGKIEAGVLAVATMFASHHQEHAGAFAGLAGAAATGTPNQKVLDAFGPMIQAAADQAALLEIAYSLEEAAAATYHFALGVLQSADAAAATATILPVESQHAVVLATVLGKTASEYLPSFQNSDKALDPAAYPVG
jgi:rubrerythrin